jgi:hypothetical protein
MRSRTPCPKISGQETRCTLREVLSLIRRIELQGDRYRCFRRLLPLSSEPRRITALGTDGFGRSENKKDIFAVTLKWIERVLQLQASVVSPKNKRPTVEMAAGATSISASTRTSPMLPVHKILCRIVQLALSKAAWINASDITKYSSFPH